MQANTKKINLVTDENIPLVETLFSNFANVRTMSGRAITSSDLNNCDILLVRSITRVDAKLLEGSPVSIVASATAGLDHIDLEYLRENNIDFFNAKGSNANSVAEYVLSSMCLIQRESDPDLFDKKIGVIGYGHVGRALCQKLETLGLHFSIYDPPLADSGTMIPGVNFCNWDELMNCQILSFHVPLIDNGDYATVQMINKELFCQWRKPSLLINTARGGICREEDLITALTVPSYGKTFNIIWDVWADEPEINRELFNLACIASPHIAGYSYDAKVQATIMLQNHIVKNLKDKKLLQVTPGSVRIQTLFDRDSDYFLLKFNANPPSSREEELSFLIDSILQVYNPAQDHQDLLRIINQSDRGSGFDALRKQYRRRLESSHFWLEDSTLSPAMQSCFKDLGFVTR